MNVRDVLRRADRAAADFDAADFVHATTREGLIERLRPVTVAARTVVDLGAATGAATRVLGRRFSGARIVSVDLSRSMLAVARQKRRRFSRDGYVQADARRLPFADGSVDVIFANLLLPWIDEVGTLFAEAARVLRREGLIAFSTLGPDSLAELRAAWRSVDRDEHVNPFPDMHDLGDAAVRAGLRDPVLDVDRLAVTYATPAALFRDLTAVGARNTLRQRRQSLTGTGRFAAMLGALETARRGDSLHFELELVYGHGFGKGAAAGGVRIGADQIGRRRR
jgi:malonyl-CoA O-methyltransferase